MKPTKPGFDLHQEIRSNVAGLAFLAAHSGPQYWDLDNRENDDSMPRVVVVALSGEDKDLEEVISLVRAIRSKQISKTQSGDLSHGFDPTIKISDIND